MISVDLTKKQLLSWSINHTISSHLLIPPEDKDISSNSNDSSSYSWVEIVTLMR